MVLDEDTHDGICYLLPEDNEESDDNIVESLVVVDATVLGHQSKNDTDQLILERFSLTL